MDLLLEDKTKSPKFGWKTSLLNKASHSFVNPPQSNPLSSPNLTLIS